MIEMKACEIEVKNLAIGLPKTLKYGDRQEMITASGIQKVLEVDALAERWRKTLAERLHKL